MKSQNRKMRSFIHNFGLFLMISPWLNQECELFRYPISFKFSGIFYCNINKLSSNLGWWQEKGFDIFGSFKNKGIDFYTLSPI